MMNCTEVKPGQCFTWEGELYQCIDTQLNKTAMAKMKVKIKVKQPKTGVVKELSLIGGDQVGEATIDKGQCNSYMIQVIWKYLWIMNHMNK